MMLASWLAKRRQSLGQCVLQAPEAEGAVWPEQSQLMLMMLASWLAKWCQSLGQFVLQASEA